MNLDQNKFKNLAQALGESYAKMLQEQQNLKDQCQMYREKIQHYVKQIEQVTKDIENMRDDYKKKGIVFEEEAQLIVNNLIPTEQIQNQINIDYTAEISDFTVICRTAYSPDGKCLAIGSNRSIRIYNIEDWNPVFEYAVDGDTEVDRHIRALAWIPQKPILISGCEDTKIRIFDIENQSEIIEISTDREIFDIKVSHNGQYFVAATNSGPLILYNANTYEKIADLATEPTDKQYPVCIAISDDDKVIASGYNNNKVIFWSYETKTTIFEQEIHDMDIYGLCFYNNSRNIASASLDKTVKLWEVGEDLKSLKPLKTLNKHTDFVLNIAIDHDNKWLISGSKDKTIIITDLRTQQMIYSLAIHTNSVITVDFCPTTHQFCSGSGDKSIKIYSYADDSGN